jgi:predicted ATPase
MITRIEALNYRCLKWVEQDLGPFHVLVGPNGSGKSTFLDVPALMRDIVRDGRQDIGDVISSRSPNYADLIWMGTGRRFELAIEAAVPKSRSSHLPYAQSVCRYDLGIGQVGQSGELGIYKEAVSVWPRVDPIRRRGLRPHAHSLGPSESGLGPNAQEHPWIVMRDNMVMSSEDYFFPESDPQHPSMFKLGPRRSAFANLPEDETRFPVATWFKHFLLDEVWKVALSAEAMRQPSPPNAKRTFLPDGSSLPWVTEEFLSGHNADMAQRWVEHLRLALPELQAIRTVERPEDRFRYLKLSYAGGVEVPSWLVSDGTLRFLALTLLAYLPGMTGTYLIEEPENGIHPTAVEWAFDSLSSMYDGQVLLATHSPAILGLSDVDKVLCFSKSEEAGVKIVPGNEHPNLKHWKGEVSLGQLFAGGVLG